jgi:hypothetical protein
VVLVERGALDFARKTSASLIAPRSRSRSFRRSRTARRCGFRPPPGAISPRYRNLASSPVTRVRIPYAPPLKSPAQATFRVLGLTLLGSWRVTKGLGAHDCNTIDTRRRTPRLSARRQLGTQNVGTSVRDLAGLSLRPPPPGARRRQFHDSLPSPPSRQAPRRRAWLFRARRTSSTYLGYFESCPRRAPAG